MKKPINWYRWLTVLVFGALTVFPGNVVLGQQAPAWHVEVDLPAGTMTLPLTGADSRLEVMEQGGRRYLQIDGNDTSSFGNVIFGPAEEILQPLGHVTRLTLRGMVKQGSVFPLILESNPSTGYTWSMKEMSHRLESLTPRAEYDEPVNRGAPQRQTMRFRALSSGEVSLQLEYRRPWEADAAVTARWQVEAGWLNVDGLDLSNPQRPEKMRRVVPLDVYTPKVGLPQGSSLTANLPARWDWREHAGQTPVRDQGSCGSCWAFGAVGVTEAAQLISGGAASVDLSEQYLVNCDDANGGCGGGLGYVALDVFKWYGVYKKDYQTDSGAVTEAVLGYTAADGSCSAVNYPKPYHIAAQTYLTGNYNLSQEEIEEVKRAIYNFGPVTAGVCAGYYFDRYTTGVLNGSDDCGSYTNHEINLVGWDDTQGGGVWILRNSWGSWWGMDGYMLIPYQYSGVGQDATFVTYSPANPADAPDAAAGALNLAAGRMVLNAGNSTVSDALDPKPACQVSSTPYQSVWFKITPAETGILHLDTAGSDYDTVLSALSGTPGAFSQAGCDDDDSYGVTSSLALPVSAGTTYHIMVSSMTPFTPPPAGQDEGTLVMNASMQVYNQNRYLPVTRK